MIYLILSYLPAAICGVHAVRTNQNQYWLFILVIGGAIGALIYAIAVLSPDLAWDRRRAPQIVRCSARYVAFMAKTGRMEDARIGLAELDRRLQKIARPLRGEARGWRDIAANAVAAQHQY